jgi:deoxycytidylate deaminase
MRYLSGDEKKKALGYISKATKVAQNATCERSKCGSVIVQLDEIIGSGFNSPPQDLEKQRRCSYSKDFYHKKVTDKTCCVHAEQRAIMDALKNNPNKLFGSSLYFNRFNDNGTPSRAGEPYCTICSKMALDVGIAEFVLWHDKGVCAYDTKEYNTLSFQFGLNGNNLTVPLAGQIIPSQHNSD